MAGGRQEEHAFRKIGSDLSAGRLPSALLLFGREQFLVKWAAGAIAEKYVPPALRELDFVRLDGGEADVGAVVAHCETLPLSGIKKIVLVEGAACFSADGGKAAGRMDEEALLAYVKTLSDSCILIFTAERADKRKKLYKSIAGNGGAYEFGTLDPASLRAFIEKRFAAAGKKAAPSVLRELAEMTGYFDKESAYTLYNMENDIRKITAYCEGREIGLADVAQVMPASLNSNIFALSDAISRGQRAEAFGLLGGILEGGSNVCAILGLLFSQFDLLLSVREMMDEGLKFSDMQARLSVHEYRLKMAAEQARRFTRASLRAILKRAYETDKNIKTGLLRDTLALEMFISAAR